MKIPIREMYPSDIEFIQEQIDYNEDLYNWFGDWLYSEGPGADERYVPDDVSDDYLEKLTHSEIDYIAQNFENILANEY